MKNRPNQSSEPTRLSGPRFPTGRVRSTLRFHSKKAACAQPRAAHLKRSAKDEGTRSGLSFYYRVQRGKSATWRFQDNSEPVWPRSDDRLLDLDFAHLWREVGRFHDTTFRRRGSVGYRCTCGESEKRAEPVARANSALRAEWLILNVRQK
jgi:hypothetical protein